PITAASSASPMMTSSCAQYHRNSCKILFTETSFSFALGRFLSDNRPIPIPPPGPILICLLRSSLICLLLEKHSEWPAPLHPPFSIHDTATLFAAHCTVWAHLHSRLPQLYSLQPEAAPFPPTYPAPEAD